MKLRNHTLVVCCCLFLVSGYSFGDAQKEQFMDESVGCQRD